MWRLIPFAIAEVKLVELLKMFVVITFSKNGFQVGSGVVEKSEKIVLRKATDINQFLFELCKVILYFNDM